MKATAHERAAGLFKHFEDLDAVYVTGDGNVFTEKHLAENNAFRCKDKKTITYKRADFEKTAAEAAKAIDVKDAQTVKAEAEPKAKAAKAK